MSDQNENEKNLAKEKLVTEELQQTKQFLELIVENIPDMVFVKSASDLKFVAFNKAAEKIIGVSREDMIGKCDYDFFTKEQADFFTEKDRKVLEGNAVLDIPQEEIKTGSGETRVLHTKKIPIKDKNGIPLFLLGISEDITEEVRSQKSEEELRKKLEQVQKLESIGQLAGGVAHDFNNILGGILGYSSLLKEKLKDQPELHRKVEIIEKSATRGSKLTSALLGFARKGSYERAKFNMNQSIEEALTLVDKTLSKKVYVETKISDSDLIINGDPTQIVQIVMNLLINAKDASQEKGTIYLESGFKNIGKKECEELGLEKIGAYSYIQVRDTGEGIPDEIRNKIFEPFFTTKPIGQGTGLGLAMIFGIVQNHGGAIHVDSKIDFGSTFTVYFPLVESEENPSALNTSQTIKEHSFKNLSILVVDDDLTMRTTLRDTLRETGAIVITAANGVEAIQKVTRSGMQFDLIVLDSVMPKMDGITAFDHIAQAGFKIPVLFSSGYAEKDRIAQLRKQNHVDFIQKPYSIPDFFEAIEKLLKANPKISHAPAEEPTAP